MNYNTNEFKKSKAYYEGKMSVAKIRRRCFLFFVAALMFVGVAFLLPFLFPFSEVFIVIAVCAIFFIGIPAIIVTLIFWISSYNCKCNKYVVDYNEIVVYVGFKQHCLKVNGELCDEHIALFMVAPITLSANIDDKYYVDCVISTGNMIRVKVNGKMIMAVK